MRPKLPILCALFIACAEAHAGQTCNDRINQTAPTSRYTDHGDGTVTDTRTGLMWQRCMMGYAYSDNSTPGNLADDACTPSATVTYLWQEALQGVADANAAGGFAGFSDWRVANIRELISLVEHQCSAPAINATIFPDTPPDAEVFSSSPANDVGAGKTTVFVLEMQSGADSSTVDEVIETAAKAVRLVRAGT
jgi:hypothetical protein